MRPEILPGDILIIKKVDVKEVKNGDIAVFKSGVHLIAHRIVGKNLRKGYFIEKGDGKYRPFKISSDSVIGKVINVQRGGRRIKVDSFALNIRSKLIAFLSYWKFILIDSTSNIRRRLRFWE